MYKSNQLHQPCSKNDLVIIIVGPTAAGKTDFSFSLAEKLSAEVVNADVGQCYRPFSVGVAKPDWQHAPVPCHLFDILDNPEDFNVVDYRARVLEKVSEIRARGNVPMLVGGSHFYIQSLFYPPRSLRKQEHAEPSSTGDNKNNSWDQLYRIDQKRAKQLHPHDTYRIERALTVWRTTGIKPSDAIPLFNQPFPALIIAVNPPDDLLKERINQRAFEMFENDEWIDEVKTLMGSQWEPFMVSKKLIGYDHIARALQKDTFDKNLLIKVIQQETWDYAKRQKKFVRRMFEKFQQEHQVGEFIGTVMTITDDSKEHRKKAEAAFGDFYCKK